jgi:glycosyltransferase involved in cell wall biosynthesis
MNALVVTPFLPYPLVFGGAIRLYHLMRMLSTFSDVSLLSYRSWSDEDPTPHLEQMCSRVVISSAKPMNRRALRARSLVSRRSYQYLAHQSRSFQQELDALVARDRYDIVLVEMTPMGQFDLPPEALRILDLQNIEHELVERRALNTPGSLRRQALNHEAHKVRQEELDICGRFDLLLATSDREADIIRTWGAPRVETMVNTVDTMRFALRDERDIAPPRLAFIGVPHVDANRDGIRYFMTEIFPLIRQAAPDVSVDIVGGNPPPDIRAFDSIPGVNVTGYVKDIRDYMATASALVVPLRSGGGTRLKILEGLSFGVPTISSSIGAEGLELEDREHIVVADDPQSFSAAVLEVLRDEELRSHLRITGRKFVEENYDWRSQASRLRRIVEDALQRKTGSPA